MKLDSVEESPAPQSPPIKEGEAQNKPRDYTRTSYQNLMTIVEALEAKSPLPATQKQLAQETGISKNAIFDICWNLVKRGWAEEVGDGSIRLKKGTDDKVTYIGRMVIRMVEDNYGVKLEEEGKGNEPEKA